MKIFGFVLAATIFEAGGDAIVRLGLRHPSMWGRLGLFVLGGGLLTAYGTSLNLAPVEFATVTGMYVALLFLVFQVVNYLFFGVLPTGSVLAGGTLIIAGGVVVYAWR
ncbi:MAG TPA: hypothetical protein VGL62_00430 [Vicinamibacterales bacterium]|jgi:small multidrug resistance family-3 protein